MRVLFATDGSRSADRARDLLGRLPWPDGTRFCVVCALEPRGELVIAPWMMPGSVSAEVVDHAPCPVLVVRGEAVDSIVFAEDGSPGAANAAHALRTWPVFRGLPVAVVSVAETALAPFAGIAAGLAHEAMLSYAKDVETAREPTRALAARGAGELRTAGLIAPP